MNGILIWLLKILMPNGRAYRVPENGFLFRLFRALSVSFARAYADATGVLDAILPDNPNFTIADAHDWYRRLGLYDSGLVSLNDMKAAIAQKMSFPVVPLNRQTRAYIESQLHAAGFTQLFVYENRFPDGMGGWITRKPSEILGANSVRAVYGFIQSGQAQYGQLSADNVTLIVNYLEEVKDGTFDVGTTFRNTFYVSSNAIGTFATVDINRKIELRQLLLKLKSAHMAGYLFINYA